MRPAERAMDLTVAKHTISVTLPDGLGTIRLPEPERLAYYGGILALAAFGILDWPIAIAVGVGHALAEQHRHRFLEDFGEALADA